MQDPEKFKSRMHSLAYGNAMMAAVRDYKEVRACQTCFTRAPKRLSSWSFADLACCHVGYGEPGSRQQATTASQGYRYR